MSEAKPSPLMYVFVITVLSIGALFTVCNRDGATTKLETKLENMSSDKERLQHINVLLKNNHREEQMCDVENTDPSLYPEKIELGKITIKHEMEDDALSIATLSIMAFFVLCAVVVAIGKFFVTVRLGLRAGKNIVGRM